MKVKCAQLNIQSLQLTFVSIVICDMKTITLPALSSLRPSHGPWVHFVQALRGSTGRELYRFHEMSSDVYTGAFWFKLLKDRSLPLPSFYLQDFQNQT